MHYYRKLLTLITLCVTTIFCLQGSPPRHARFRTSPQYLENYLCPTAIGESKNGVSLQQDKRKYTYIFTS